MPLPAGPTSPPAGSAPVAQLDRAPDYESGGQEFESLRARHFRFDIKCLRGRLCAHKSAQQIGRVYVVLFCRLLQ
jgi:hypothetical protein